MAMYISNLAIYTGSLHAFKNRLAQIIREEPFLSRTSQLELLGHLLYVEQRFKDFLFEHSSDELMVDEQEVVDAAFNSLWAKHDFG